jgi:hypothetical protein
MSIEILTDPRGRIVMGHMHVPIFKGKGGIFGGKLGCKIPEKLKKRRSI